MEGLILLFIGLIVFGLLLSLVALIPPLRKWASHATQRRGILAVLVAILAFALAFLILSPGVARVNAFFVCRDMDEWDGVFYCGDRDAQLLGYPSSKALSESIHQELWRRLLVPALFQKPCYSQNLSLCNFIDEERRRVEEYVELLLILACIPGLVAGIQTWCGHGRCQPMYRKHRENGGRARPFYEILES